MTVAVTEDEKSKVELGDVYPTDWDSFIGQDKAKRQLRMAAAAARMSGERAPHMLLASGAHGIGKTALSLLVAQEIGTGFKAVSGAIDRNAAVTMLADREDNDVIFWDEFHNAVVGGKSKVEWLLNYLQDGVLLGPYGPEEVPKCTIIAATTEPGKLPETIISRFQCQPVLTEYSDDEATKIAVVKAAAIFTKSSIPLPTPAIGACRGAAAAANNNPREIHRIFSTVRNIAMVENLSNWDGTDYDLSTALELLEITPDGLSHGMQRYLLALIGPLRSGGGEKAIMEVLQEPGGIAHYERVLMAKGYLRRDNRGRSLSITGARRAKELADAGVTL